MTKCGVEVRGKGANLLKATAVGIVVFVLKKAVGKREQIPLIKPLMIHS